MLTAGQAVFGYTGGSQAWTIPQGVVSAYVTLIGAAGGQSDVEEDYLPDLPAQAADVQGTLTWPVGTTALDVWVGGIGGNATGKDLPGAGGFNGGADGGNGSEFASAGGGGGGATDIRLGSPATRVMVAGGAGGQGGMYAPYGEGDGGPGGSGTAVGGVWLGGNGTNGARDNGGPGGSGGVYSDGQGSAGGNAGTATGNGGGGGGGGGWFGGQGGGAGQAGLFGDAAPGGGGGGGSSYAHPAFVTNTSAFLADAYGMPASATINWVNISTTSLSTLVAATPTNQQLVATFPPENPTTWQVTAGGLPAGLSLSSSGRLTGTPTTAGDYSFTVTVTAQPNAVATSTWTYQGSVISTAGPPTSVQGTPAYESVALAWAAPSFTGGAAITGYAVRYSTNGGGSWIDATPDTGSATTTFTVTGLTSGVGYQFQVAAINAAGTGPFSTASAVVVPSGVNATLSGDDLSITVNGGSTAYFRQVGTAIEVANSAAFSFAQQFVAASVTQVTVTGNATNAGFVFTTGPVNAALQTSTINAITFGSTAAFTGSVEATLTTGTLVVSGAVRGLAGVELDAPAVRLANDVEIDGGIGGVTFTGTVDGQTQGGQALTVTAIEAIAFQQAVGGVVPLKALETRAVRPLTLSTDVSQSRTIPLHYLPYTQPGGNVEDKYGIEVAVGNNPARMYEFDTGGTGFWAGYNPEWWQGVVPSASAPFMKNHYTSGNFFDGVATSAVLTLGSGLQKVSTGGAVQLTAITVGGNTNTGASFDFSTASKPPIEGHFFGDFGASFGIASTGGGAIEPPVQVTNPLLQLPGNLSSGFVVQLGPLGRSPRLVVGITDDLRVQFPTAIPLTEIDGLLYPNPNGAAFRRQVYEQFAFSGQYSLSRDGQQASIGTIPTLIDSGAPTMTIHYPDPEPPAPGPPFVNGGVVTNGTTFTGMFSQGMGVPPFEWRFDAGSVASINSIDFTTNDSAASTGNSVNTGLNFYNGYDVMFDVATGYLRLRPSGGMSSVHLQSVTTTGGQSYGQNAKLSGTYATGGGAFSVAGATALVGNVVVEAGAGSVTFSGTVDGTTAGGQSLEIESSGGTSFVRPVGGATALASLTTDAGGSTSAVSVTTLGPQSYGDNVSLNGQYTTGVTFSAWQTTTLVGAVGITSASKVMFNGRIDSAAGKGFPLTVSSGKGDVVINGAVGSVQPLGGLAITGGTAVTAAGRVTLDGSLPYAASSGLWIADVVTATFASGGSIRRFSGSGLVFNGSSQGSEIRGFTIADNVYDGIQVAANPLLDEQGLPEPADFTGTVIAGNTIRGNSAFGIELAAPVTGLTISGNTIGGQGTRNTWDVVTGGPNAHGIVLAPGDSSGTTISGNTIRFNRRSGIMAAGGVQGVSITDNTIQRNVAHGIEFATGDFTGTTITANAIRLNGGDGISLGAGIGQGTMTGGNPQEGYAAEEGHYRVSYANSPNFYDPSTPPADPQIAMQVGTKQLTVNMDTGSRGLYFDALQLDPAIVAQGQTGHVYLNSSNRLYFGRWSMQTITFTQSSYVGTGKPAGSKATATVPILAVTAIGASTTPAPGSTVANTTFGTNISSGTITITNGTLQRTVGIVPNVTGSGPAGTVTIPGGWWANYSDNMLTATTSKLASVANFGIGFDRTGLGTVPTSNGFNQAYNAFLNLAEMRDGSMRAGYVISATGVTLGLDSTVSGFASTDLAPTGLPQGTQSAPDWQPATGTVDYPHTASGTGQIVIDMGIPSGILTLPGKSPTSNFGGTMTVNLLNSNGAVRYDIDTSDSSNLLNPTAVAFFDPLAGAYTENMPPQSGYFFNTGRKVFAAFDYLYDAAGGLLGLKVGSTTNAQNAFAGNGQFTAAHYANPNAPTGVTNLMIGGTAPNPGNTNPGNTITGNTGNGVTVNGAGSLGNAILSNSIFANGGLGIDLANGGNASQVAPALDPAIRLVGEKTIVLTGTLAATAGYSGTYRLQFFSAPYAESADAGAIEGRRLLGEITNVSAGPFSATFARGVSGLGDWITVTATPESVPFNTSEFSGAARVMTLVVDTAADAGTGSLRSAMALANANPGGEVIEFGIPGGPGTITVRSALPTITGAMLIDGRPQTVTVSGSALAGAANGFTVAATAAQTEIRSLTIAGFARGSGIWSAAANAVFDGNTLRGNFNGLSLVGGVGATVSGNMITASGNWGVYATGGLAGASLVRNTITSTVLVGIYAQNATGLFIGREGAGNEITGGTARGLYSTGIYVTGASANTRVQANTVSGNGSGVMLVDARGVLVGGTSDGERNAITGNRGYGLFATGNSAGSVVRRNVISGNGRNVITARAFALVVRP